MTSAESRRTRVEACCHSLGITVADLARKAGKTPSFLYAALAGKKNGQSLWGPVSEALRVDIIWLQTGDPSCAPSWWNQVEPPTNVTPSLIADLPTRIALSKTSSSHTERPAAGVPDQIYHHVSTELVVIGTVSAGDGKLPSEWLPSSNTMIRIPSQWAAVKIMGDSAYPVAYNGQLALVDLSRAASPQTLDEGTFNDLHNNLVLIQTEENGTHCAYLKRFCWEPRSPQGFTLASADSGRSSPYLPLESILLIAPVVAVMFEDPREPRVKGRNRADVKTGINQ